MSLLDASKFAVWGLGVSGVAAANRLAEVGKSVVASDSRAFGPWAENLILHPSVELRFGQNALEGAEVVIPSPGLKPSLPVFESLPQSVQVYSEIDLAYELADCDFVSVTGTDGKTTTTSLIAHILEVAGIPGMAAGNIGIPLSEAITKHGAGHVIVAEISEFQLWSSKCFRARANAFTNIAEDHLDYFTSMEEIIAAERVLVENATPDDVMVFNLNDPVLTEWANAYQGPMGNYIVGAVSGGSGQDKPVRNVSERSGDAVRDVQYRESIAVRDVPVARGDTVQSVPFISSDELRVFEADKGVLDLSSTELRGRHNVMNIMAAAQVARVLGASWDTIQQGIDSFRPLAHRMQLVHEIDGLRFYDDSKATNAHASMAGLKSIEGSLVVIAGGVEKGLPLEQWARLLALKEAKVVVIGEIKERMRAELQSAGVQVVLNASSMEDAVDKAMELAQTPASIVLSPACSSFDMFKSYAHRGEVFAQAARERA